MARKARKVKPAPREVTARVELNVGGDQVKVELTVPAGPSPPSAVLPAVRVLTNAIVANAERASEALGLPISCCVGCAACCRQLVPISGIEARRLRDLVRALPEPRRSAVIARFAEALRRLDEAGLLDPIRDLDGPDTDHQSLGLAYVHQGIPCPFLDAESCSIHPERPIVCREYLVTSPAKNCQTPGESVIRKVDVPASLASTLARFEQADPSEGARVALVLALEWAESHPEPPPSRTGPEWVRELFARWGRKDVPLPGAGLG